MYYKSIILIKKNFICYITYFAKQKIITKTKFVVKKEVKMYKIYCKIILIHVLLDNIY